MPGKQWKNSLHTIDWVIYQEIRGWMPSQEVVSWTLLTKSHEQLPNYLLWHVNGRDALPACTLKAKTINFLCVMLLDR